VEAHGVVALSIIPLDKKAAKRHEAWRPWHGEEDVADRMRSASDMVRHGLRGGGGGGGNEQ